MYGKLTNGILDTQAIELSLRKARPDLRLIDLRRVLDTTVQGNNVLDENVDSHLMLLVLLVDEERLLEQTVPFDAGLPERPFVAIQQGLNAPCVRFASSESRDATETSEIEWKVGMGSEDSESVVYLELVKVRCERHFLSKIRHEIRWK